MATGVVELLITPTVNPGVDPANPFRYGWRPVEQRRPDGTLDVIRVPLTLDDLLHPREGDQVTHSDAHERCCVYLYTVFTAQVASDTAAVVLKDVLVDWGIPDLRPHGPDLAVIFGVRERQNWSTFDVVAEGTRPALIVEVTSPETATIDRLVKHDEYEMADVPLYVVVDLVPRRGLPSPRLLGFALGPDGYRETPTSDEGHLWLEPLGLWLGVDGDAVVCYDAAGTAIGDFTAQVAARVEALAAREEAQTAQAAAEARIQALEAELRRLRGEA